MAQHGKRTSKAREGIDREKLYSIDDAVKMIKDRAKAKFDETIEIAMNLGIDPRHADQAVRGMVELPSGTGKTVRVAVFAQGEKAREARDAGADVVGSGELVETVMKGEIGCRSLRIVSSTQAVMARVSALAASSSPANTGLANSRFQSQNTFQMNR